MKLWRIGPHPVHPYLEYLEVFDEGKGVKIFPKGFAIDSLGGGFNPAENIRGLPEMNEVGEIVLMGATGKSHIDLHHVDSRFLRDEEIDPEIQEYLPETKDRPSGLSSIGENYIFLLVWGLPLFFKREPGNGVNRKPCICTSRKTS
jgi:hypothetical protein